MSYKTLGLVLVLASLTLPFAVANHGLAGVIVATLDDGTTATASIGYVAGNFNTQTWSFAWNGGASCLAFGSLEIGFTSLAGCATPFSTGGTGDSHSYPHGQVDAHQIAVTLGGVSGTGQQIVCPDSGNLAAGCAIALGTL